MAYTETDSLGWTVVVVGVPSVPHGNGRQEMVVIINDGVDHFSQRLAGG